MNRNRMLAAVLFGLLTAGSQAKPPDLPLDTKVECREIEVETGHLVWFSDAEESSLADEQCCPCLDTCCAGVCHWLFQALGNACSQTRNSAEAQRDPEESDKPAGTLDESDLDDLLQKSQLLRQQSQEPSACPAHQQEVHHESLARELYRIAERCRKSGDHAMARSCYDEVQRMSPNTRLARRASQRLEWCQQSFSGQEEAEVVGDGSPKMAHSSRYRSTLSLTWPVAVDFDYACDDVEARARITLRWISIEFRSSTSAAE